MPRTQYHRCRVPKTLKGVVVQGIKLSGMLNVPLRDGTTKAKAIAWAEDLFAEAKSKINFKLSDAGAWELATTITARAANLPALMTRHMGIRTASLFNPEGTPSARGWAARMGLGLSLPDVAKLQRWIDRVHEQRERLGYAALAVDGDDPEALRGEPRKDATTTPLQKAIQSARSVVGQSPLHSDVTKAYFLAKKRSGNYRRALEQFREQCGDKEVGQYTPDDCWKFRNWLSEALDEKKGEKLAGQTKNHKLSAVRSLFDFTIEKRHRNDNPMRDVKPYSKKDNVKKHRRLYTKDELTALFVKGKREGEWKYWTPLLAIYSGVRITEGIQLRPEDVSNAFGVWHIIIRPGRGQNVKGDKARVVPIHKELIRLGFLVLHKRAIREKREWLFWDVPLVEKVGMEYNAPDVAKIMVPSQNAATQWFGRYSDSCEVRDPNVDFHALRGAFLTYGSQQGRDLSLRMELAGHSKGSDVHSRYIYAGAPLQKLKAEIDAIKYPMRPT